MKEYRITSENIVGKSNADCYLSPDDPVWEMLGIEGRVNMGEFLQNVDVIKRGDSSDSKT